MNVSSQNRSGILPLCSRPALPGRGWLYSNFDVGRRQSAAAIAISAFTLVELMVSTAIIGLIMLVLVSMTNQISNTWRSSTEKIEKFQEARDGFESMTRRLAQATLNNYWDYLDYTGTPRNPNTSTSAFKNFIPYMYGRMSNLRFASGPMSQWSAASGVTSMSADMNRPGMGVFFQAPFGLVTTADDQSPDPNNGHYGLMNNLLNTWGYFVEVDYDSTVPTFVTNTGTVKQRWRPRLMEFCLPSEQMALYDPTDTTYKWFSIFIPKVGLNSVPPRPVRVLAENILTLIILPKLSDADQQALNATYGSTTTLCPYYAYTSYPVDAAGVALQPPANPGVPSGLTPGLAASLNPKHQLPPIVSVTMVAVDERSAERLCDSHNLPQGGAGAATQSDAMMGLNYSGLFLNSANLEGANTGDLWSLEQALVKEKVTYRVFTTNVTIRGAKWSRSQTK
jgi:uncharacterized protein (TIGR02599 family)